MSAPVSHHTRSARTKDISLEQANRLASYAPTIQEASRKYNVPVELICAVILQESGGNPKAVSPAGARGLMQLMPATAKRFGVTNSLDPRQNIDGGTKYL
ncbi:MAG: transglycosylase SLT domain-containing protein, partial [Deltaproteobacteria bacterium]|nr:transglycosylase SLT domain-containing protein [Deltaproteobacteria bacterium]